MELDEFLKTCQEAGKRLAEFNDAVIVHHFDADGIAAGAITFSGMLKNGVEPTVQCWKKITPENLQQLSETTNYEQIVFCDLSVSPEEAEKYFTNREIVILDHHELKGEYKENVFLANPHSYGIDGSVSVSGGGTSYLAFRKYPELAQLALVSAIGDLQDRDGLTGVNELILKDAIKSGVAITKKDLRLFGRSARNLIAFLSYCSEPFLPGLTGNDKTCAQFLAENEIPFKKNDKFISYYELTDDEQKQLASALIEYCFMKKMPEKVVEKIIGDTYLFPSEVKGTPFYDAHEFATLLNACGRNNAAQVGFGACIKRENDREAAVQLVQRHRINLRKGIGIAKRKISDAGPFYLIDCRGQVKDSIIGTVAGAVLYSVEPNKPVIAIANDDEDETMVKISTRATKVLVANGVDLNYLLKTATKDLGKSAGGGHTIASGASVEKKYLPEFLKRCAEILKEQEQTQIEQ
ncbi:MAG: DHH family phosphoesterase [Candidatus Micrarchaeota archaeon]